MGLVDIEANPRCKYCLGSGESFGFFADGPNVCPCVTEQLRIITVDRDYRTLDRYSPGRPTYVRKGGESTG